MTITLPPELEERIRTAAAARGVDAPTFIRDLVIERLQDNRDSDSLQRLFDSWPLEDATADAEPEAVQLKRALNQNRIESDGPGSRTPFEQ